MSMKKLPNRRPVIVRRKHRKPACTFGSDPENAVSYQKSDSKKSVEVEHPDIKNPKKERSACEINYTKQKRIKQKFENSPNQFDSSGGKKIQ